MATVGTNSAASEPAQLLSGQPGAGNAGGKTVYLETFGCQMNVLDSQLVDSQLRGMGYRFVEQWQEADVILYNTCSVREQAENKVYSRIGQVGIHKNETNPDVVLGVIGCMAERDGIDMVRRYPQIDLMCGPGELDKVPMLIDNAVKTRIVDVGRRSYKDAPVALQGNTHRRSSTLAAAEDKLELLDLSRSFSPDGHQGSAYVRITRGCNKFCTYCVVPNTRGAEVHRPPDHVVEECKKLVDSGVIEITLLGQTVNHYHYNHGAAVLVNGMQQPQVGGVVTGHGVRGGSGQVTTFADLLHRIHEQVPGLKRLRFVTSFPRDFGDDILQVMADSPRICRYLHIPGQSGSDRILKLMNRDYTVASYLELLDRARGFMPDIELAGDLICGFPSETEEDHLATCDLLRKARYKNCFIFKYSPRPDTVAIDKFQDDVPDADKRRRNNELLAIQSEVSTVIHENYVGKTVRVFVEGVSQKQKKAQLTGEGQAVFLGWEGETTQLSGRTDGDLIAIFDGDESLVGSIIDVKVNRAAPLTLFGKVANHPATV